MIENISIYCKINNKYALIPVYTKNENMILQAFRLLQSNPDLPNEIKAQELDESKIGLLNRDEFIKKEAKND